MKGGNTWNYPIRWHEQICSENNFNSFFLKLFKNNKITTNTGTAALINHLEDLSFFVVVVVIVLAVFNLFLIWVACGWQLCHFLLLTWKSDREILSKTKLNVILLKKAPGKNTKQTSPCLVKYSVVVFFFCLFGLLFVYLWGFCWFCFWCFVFGGGGGGSVFSFFFLTCNIF